MFGKSPKLIDSVTVLVPAGERVLAAVCVQPKGAAMGMAVGGIAGAALAGRGSKDAREVRAATGVDVPRHAAIAVTSQRVLVLKMNAMGSKATEITGELPLDAVHAIDVDSALIRKKVVVRTTRGDLELEAGKGFKVEDLPVALAAARHA